MLICLNSNKLPQKKEQCEQLSASSRTSAIGVQLLLTIELQLSLLREARPRWRANFVHAVRSRKQLQGWVATIVIETQLRDVHRVHGL